MARRQARIIEPEDDDWLDDDEEGELPPRPRNRLLHPLPMGLIVVLIAALGFLAGVLVQKHNESGASTSFTKGAAAVSTASGKKSSGSKTTKPSFDTSTAGSSISGTVSSVKGGTLYVKDSEGAIIEVKADAGSTVTRDAKTTIREIHPGDTVVIEGSKSGSTVKASSVAATESGVETTTGLTPTLGSSSTSSSSSSSKSAESSLFGE